MINYVEGNVLNPIGEEESKLICHVVNNKGVWGAGFVVNLSKKWKKPEEEYRRYCRNNIINLGYVQFVQVEDNIFVANMFAQDGFVNRNNPVALNYIGLECCLKGVNDFCGNLTSIHMPYIGCGLAGGKWEKVEEIVKKILKDKTVYVYSFK